MLKQPPLDPARTVIEICGGIAATAKLAGRDKIRVRRWTYSKERGGTGGLIPSDMQVVLMRSASEEGIDLKPEHFFENNSSNDNNIGTVAKIASTGKENPTSGDAV